METKRPESKFVDVRGAVITGIVVLIFSILLALAHQLLWAALTFLLGAWLTWHILTHRPQTSARPTSREDITAAEIKNNLQPLDWEPVKTAKAAEQLLTDQLGDLGWQTQSGTVAVSAPLQFVVQASDGTRKTVTAAGEILSEEDDSHDDK